eukprot:m.58749 g.58749  ORF g.58749 m.58749 type:complete len:311 (+) comp13531_c0_seq1:394-1326(+)
MCPVGSPDAERAPRLPASPLHRLLMHRRVARRRAVDGPGHGDCRLIGHGQDAALLLSRRECACHLGECAGGFYRQRQLNLHSARARDFESAASLCGRGVPWPSADAAGLRCGRARRCVAAACAGELAVACGLCPPARHRLGRLNPGPGSGRPTHARPRFAGQHCHPAQTAGAAAKHCGLDDQLSRVGRPHGAAASAGGHVGLCAAHTGPAGISNPEPDAGAAAVRRRNSVGGRVRRAEPPGHSRQVVCRRLWKGSAVLPRRGRCPEQPLKKKEGYVCKKKLCTVGHGDNAVIITAKMIHMLRFSVNVLSS